MQISQFSQIEGESQRLKFRQGRTQDFYRGKGALNFYQYHGRSEKIVGGARLNGGANIEKLYSFCGILNKMSQKGRRANDRRPPSVRLSNPVTFWGSQILSKVIVQVVEGSHVPDSNSWCTPWSSSQSKSHQKSCQLMTRMEKTDWDMQKRK